MKNKLIVLILGLFLFISCNTTKNKTEHGWLTNLEDGIDIAKKEKKTVFTLVTGSDWCPPCKKLHHDILESEDFKSFAKDNLILVELDFPKKQANKLSPEQTKYNQSVKRKFQVRGFPTVIMLNEEGQELNRWVGYRSTPLETMLDKYQSAIK